MSRKDNIFKQVPVNKVPRNMFDLSHEVKMTGKFGLLYPMFIMDTLPGDSVREQMTTFMRVAPMLRPVMHRVDVKQHWFFVPYRILIGGTWEKFITGGQDGEQNPVVPYVTPFGLRTAWGNMDLMRKGGSLWDYLGLPCFEGAEPGSAALVTNEHLSALPFLACTKIWSDWYRDPNFDAEVEFPILTEGDVSANTIITDHIELKRKAWDKDRFTSALPWPQRGPEVLVPMEGVASDFAGNIDYYDRSRVIDTGSGLRESGALSSDTDGLTDGVFSVNGDPARLENIDQITVENLSVTINDLRTAFALQKWMENNALGGGRYIESIQTHFNKRVPDYRLQRAEYLGGGAMPIQISEVLSTAQSAENDVLGDLAGHGIAVGKANRFSYHCDEHGLIIGFVSVVPVTGYSQGIDRLWSRVSRFDYAWPELANLGEQEIVSKEVFFSFLEADEVANQGLFGYTPRYSEYKMKMDRIAGDFRTTMADWHLSRLFDSRPVLDEQFTTMYEHAPDREESYRRIFAVQDGTDYLWFQLFHRCTALRPLPYFGIPSTLR